MDGFTRGVLIGGFVAAMTATYGPSLASNLIEDTISVEKTCKDVNGNVVEKSTITVHEAERLNFKPTPNQGCEFKATKI